MRPGPSRCSIVGADFVGATTLSCFERTRFDRFDRAHLPELRIQGLSAIIAGKFHGPPATRDEPMLHRLFDSSGKTPVEAYHPKDRHPKDRRPEDRRRRSRRARAVTGCGLFFCLCLAPLQNKRVTGMLTSRMDNLTKREQPDRSKINMREVYEVKHWTRALGVSREQLQKAVDKVGNSAAAVRKELAT